MAVERYARLSLPGDVKFSLIKADHDGWLLLDGRQLKKADFPNLFAKLKLTGTTFTLPSAKDRMVMAAGGTSAVGDIGGDLKVTLSLANLPAHHHGVPDATMELSRGKASVLTGLVDVLTGWTSKSGTKQSADAGGGDPITLPRPPYLALNAFIYAG